MLVPSRYKALYGGRGSLKSHFFSELACEYAVQIPGFRMVCVREVQKSLKDSAKRLIEDKIKALSLPNFRPLHDRIDTPGGGVILFQGMQDHTAESIKSLEGFDVAWSEEAQTTSARTLEFLRPTIRKDPTEILTAGSELWFSWNPRNPSDPVDKFFRSMNPPDDAIIIRTNHKDNPWFPKVLEEERLYDMKNSSDRYGHVWEGDYEPVALGALWNRQLFHAHRVEVAPPMTRIAVGLDPAISNTENSDKTGIIVVGLGRDGRGYVLDNLSIKGTPAEWAARTVAAYDKWEADVIVAENNQGGDMIKHTLRTVRRSLPVVDSWATRRKAERAKPISALYHLGRFSHVGTFEVLEDQMCKITAEDYEGEGSPDELDAMIHAARYLFPAMTRPVEEEMSYEIPKLRRIA